MQFYRAVVEKADTADPANPIYSVVVNLLLLPLRDLGLLQSRCDDGDLKAVATLIL